MRISVIIPAYNAAGSLAACLDSVKFPGAEVLVVDDGSTDSTVGIASKYSGIKLIRQPHAGPAAARNLGADHARAGILLFLDSDVKLMNMDIEKLEESLRPGSRTVAVQGVYTPLSSGRNIYNLYKDLYYDYFFSRIPSGGFPPVSTHCLAIKRDLFLEMGGFDPGITHASIEDAELGSRLYRFSSESVVLDRSLQVMHLKEYGPGSFLREGYIAGINKAKSLLRTREVRRLINIAPALRQTSLYISSVLLADFSVAGTVYALLTGRTVFALIPVLLYLFMRLPFLTFAVRRYGSRALAVILPDILNSVVVSYAVFIGSLQYLVFGRRY